MTKEYKLPENNGLEMVELFIKQEADKAYVLKDNSAYNKLMVLKLNLREVIDFFERRIK